MKKFQTYKRQLRANMTDVEHILWFHLRGKRFCGLKFRRQVQIGNYIVDFVCFKKKIIIELDGGQHAEKKCEHYDKKRTEWLKKEGFEVVRFWNNEVLENLDNVMQAIYLQCNK